MPYVANAGDHSVCPYHGANQRGMVKNTSPRANSRVQTRPPQHHNSVDQVSERDKCRPPNEQAICRIPFPTTTDDSKTPDKSCIDEPLCDEDSTPSTRRSRRMEPTTARSAGCTADRNKGQQKRQKKA